MHKIKVFAGGCWDLLHSGHLNLIKSAKSMGDILIVGVSTDELIMQYKGKLPVMSYEERFALIKELKSVDEVVMQKQIFDVDFFIENKYDIFIVGDDWKNKEHQVPGLKKLKEMNVLRYVPYTQHLSSSLIKEKIIRQFLNHN